jgi:hypothetical protein
MDAVKLYDVDFFEWTQRNAALLRSGAVQEADLEHIAEEIEDMGKRDRRAVWNRTRVLLNHLLKCVCRPERRSASLERSIDEQRHRLELILRDSPSLQRFVRESLSEIYCDAAASASREMRRPVGIEQWTLEQILDPSFLP